jgi:predicted hydrolase (HD superfamily)
MTLTRDEAWNHLCEWTETDSLRKHARAVELVMRAASPKYGGAGADPDVWGQAGMLHDADYEKWPEDHPKRIVAWLRERGEAALADAISTHYTKWGPAETPMARALLACDELTGFVVACTMVRPDGIASLEAKSVVKRLKDKSFAAKVERAEIQKGAEGLGVEAAAHIQFVIDALRPHAAELGLTGRTVG